MTVLALAMPASPVLPAAPAASLASRQVPVALRRDSLPALAAAQLLLVMSVAAAEDVASSWMEQPHMDLLPASLASCKLVMRALVPGQQSTGPVQQLDPAILETAGQVTPELWLEAAPASPVLAPPAADAVNSVQKQAPGQLPLVHLV